MAVNRGVVALMMAAMELFSTSTALAMRVKGMALLIAPSSRKAFQFLRKSGSPPAKCATATSSTAEIHTRRAIKKIGPKSGPATRMNKNAPPQMAESSSSIKKYCSESRWIFIGRLPHGHDRTIIQDGGPKPAKPRPPLQKPGRARQLLILVGRSGERGEFQPLRTAPHLHRLAGVERPG